MSSASIIPLLNKWREGITKLMKSSEKVAIIHHWDTDGIASAVLMSKLFIHKSFSYHIPRIGLYELDAIDIRSIRNYSPDVIMILDYGVGKDVIEELRRELGGRLIVIDHHITNLKGDLICNPVNIIHNKDGVPSTTWLIRDIFRIERYPTLIALGVAGDYGRYLEKSNLLKIIKDMIREKNISIDQLIKASLMIDACYRCGDYNGIHHARQILMKYGVEKVLEDAILKKNLEYINEEIHEILSEITEIKIEGPIIVFEVETNNYITSYLGRELAYKYNDRIIVLINYVKRLGISYIYVRSYKYSLNRALMELRRKGLYVGGKDNVFVVTCKTKDCEEEKDLTLRVLMKTLSGD